MWTGHDYGAFGVLDKGDNLMSQRAVVIETVPLFPGAVIHGSCPSGTLTVYRLLTASIL